ncbi:MAG: hypothetical protein IPJ34_42310 [Myxococcales bacterium]|nr:hypothetical protein [Myxococcales bacterium]
MLFALRIGPIETGDGPIRISIGGKDDGSITQPSVVRSDAEGLRALAKAGTGPLLCDKSLALAGRAHGFTVAEPPSWLLQLRAGLAVAMSQPQSLRRVTPPAVLALLEASVDFWRAEPWLHVDSNDVLLARLRAPEERTFEASILGSAGMEYGLALYEDLGTMAEIRRLRGKPAAATKLNSIAVTYDPGPEFVLDALEGVFDIGGAPVPMRVEAGRLGSLTSREVLVVAAALRAAAAMGAGGQGIGKVQLDAVTVEMELSRAAATTAPPAEVSKRKGSSSSKKR